jgi:hypothetical protein
MKWLRRILLALAVLFLLAQFVRPNRTNSPVTAGSTIYAQHDVPPHVKTILERSCRDCHTNRTEWPWYSNVTPVSWWLVDHIKEGRQHLNFDEWGGSPKDQRHTLEELCEEVEEKHMPPENYLPMHPEAKLSDADRAALCQWTDELRDTLR